jgi:predicted nuclease with TOPRIM domain
MEDVKSVITDLGKAFEEFKKTNDARLAEIDKRGSELGDTKEKLERVEADMDQLSDIKARLDRLAADSTNRKEIDENPICRRLAGREHFRGVRPGRRRGDCVRQWRQPPDRLFDR